MANNNLDIVGAIREAFVHQGNGDVPRALVLLGGATIMIASAGANHAPPRMLADHEHAYLVFFFVVFAWGMATMSAGLWAIGNPRFRRAVGEKLFRATIFLLFVAYAVLGAEAHLSV